MNKLPVRDEEQNSDDQGKKRKTTANLSDECQNLQVSRREDSIYLWRRYKDYILQEMLWFYLIIFICYTRYCIITGEAD